MGVYLSYIIYYYTIYTYTHILYSVEISFMTNHINMCSNIYFQLYTNFHHYLFQMTKLKKNTYIDVCVRYKANDTPVVYRALKTYPKCSVHQHTTKMF